jgi:hypothetical protein
VTAGVPITIRRAGTLVEVCEACLARDAEDFGLCSTCIAGDWPDDDVPYEPGEAEGQTAVNQEG